MVRAIAKVAMNGDPTEGMCECRGVIYDDLHKGCSRLEFCGGTRLRLMIAAGYETAIILAMFRQYIIAQNFMLRAMGLMRMQTARR